MRARIPYLTPIAVSLGLLCAPGANVLAELQSQWIEYKDGDETLKGYLAWDDKFTGKRPGILVVHEWWGMNDYVRKRADMLASLGYVAFAPDLYGVGKVTRHAEEAKGWMQQITADIDHWTRRAELGLAQLKSSPVTDAERTAAIGYCFGGATAMQMAYAGMDIDGVVSFHGSLPVPKPEQEDNIKAQILIAHGNADPFIPAERIGQLQIALDRAGADWQMARYGNAMHGFTNPNAGSYGLDPIQYNEQADKRSWALMQQFLTDLFGE